MSQMDAGVHELMNIPAAAEFLGVNEEVLRRWARTGKVPAGKLGRAWRFSKRQLLEFVEAGGTCGRHEQPPSALQGPSPLSQRTD